MKWLANMALRLIAAILGLGIGVGVYAYWNVALPSPVSAVKVWMLPLCIVVVLACCLAAGYSAMSTIPRLGRFFIETWSLLGILLAALLTFVLVAAAAFVGTIKPGLLGDEQSVIVGVVLGAIGSILAYILLWNVWRDSSPLSPAWQFKNAAQKAFRSDERAPKRLTRSWQALYAERIHQRKVDDPVVEGWGLCARGKRAAILTDHVQGRERSRPGSASG